MINLIKKLFLFALALSLYAQQGNDRVAMAGAQGSAINADSESVLTSEPVLTDEEKLCKEVAEDLMDIYDNWSPERDYRILFPRIRDFTENFYKEYPDFNLKIIEKDRLGQELNDYERRSLVAFKGTRNDKIFEEVSRFITTKDFYWGYIEDSLSAAIDEAADKIKNYTYSRKDILLAEHEDFVDALLVQLRKLDMQLDSIKNISDEKILDDLLADEYYNNEMLDIEFEIDSAKTRNEAKNIIEKLYNERDIRIIAYIKNKKKEIIENKRLEKIAAKDYWVEEKRQTVFDLYELEKARLSDIVYGFTSPMEEERDILSFDISPEFIKRLHENDPAVSDEFKLQIKHKFYGGLVGAFGSAVIFDEIPVFRTFRTNVLIGTFLFMILFFYIFLKVKKNRESLFIRKIPGLDAIDDAVGRATEMGKPIVYDSGIGYYTQIDTIASMLILRSVAKKVAEFKAEIYVPTCDPIVMQISEEMVASGFLDAGFPEDHKKDNIFYLAADQFAFAAGIAGILSRKKPATAFHFGYYAAESLLISEAGFAAGAIQVAGTTAVAQIPFFITACDYTLIGEELYAAAAYISRDPQIMTNLKLSDFAKVVIGFLFILGTIVLTINSEWTFLQDLLFTR